MNKMYGTGHMLRALTNCLSSRALSPPRPLGLSSARQGFGMETARYYRVQADICNQLARQIHDGWVIVSLRELAQDYLSIAERLEAADHAMPRQPANLAH